MPPSLEIAKNKLGWDISFLVSFTQVRIGWTASSLLYIHQSLLVCEITESKNLF